MAWKKASPEVLELFAALEPDDPLVESRKMFGFPCLWVHGNMFAAVFEDDIVVRLGEDERAEVLGLPGGAQFEPMAGRPMREYVALPQTMHDDLAAMRAWVLRGLAYAGGLPPKEPKKRKAPGAGKGRPRS